VLEVRGFLFTELVEFVEQAHGLELVDRWLDSCKLESGGAFVATDHYSIAEMTELVTKLSETIDVPVPDLLRIFGEHIFSFLVRTHPGVMDKVTDPLTLFENLEGHVHVEVRKLYPGAEVPHFRSRRLGDGRMILTYESSRALGDLAHGLIIGAAKHYERKIEIERNDLSDGAGTCVEFHLTLDEADERPE